MIFMADCTNFSVMTYLMRTTGLLTQPEKAVHPNDTTTSASISAGQSAKTKPSFSLLTREHARDCHRPQLGGCLQHTPGHMPQPTGRQWPPFRLPSPVRTTARNSPAL